MVTQHYKYSQNDENRHMTINKNILYKIFAHNNDEYEGISL